MTTAPAVQPASNACLDADTGELIPREIDGFIIHQRAKDGYVNATAMCKAAGKLIGNWSQNAENKQVLASLARSIGIPIDLLVDTIVTGSNEYRGTWVHPKVAIHLATWCSPDFFARVIEWVHDRMDAGSGVNVGRNTPGHSAHSRRVQAPECEVEEGRKRDPRQIGH